MVFDPIRPWRLGSYPLWHLPLPNKHQISGEHPSTVRGYGEEIVEIREMEGGEGPERYSSVLSARMKKRMAVYYLQNEEVEVQFILDAGPAMDFGNPTKLLLAVKIISSLAANIFIEPNQGTASFLGIGSRILHFPSIGDQTAASGALRQLAHKLETYPDDNDGIMRRVLKKYSSTAQKLICIFSDFLIPPHDDAAWEHLENACRRVEREGNEVIFVRVLTPLECEFPNVSVTIRGAGRAACWSGAGTRKQILRIQSAIRERLNTLCKKPDIRFLEIVWNDDQNTTAFELQEFLKRRSKYLRAHLDVASA